MHACAEVLETLIETLAVSVPRHAVHSGRCIRLKLGIGITQKVDSDVMEQCGEPHLLVQPCGCPYAIQSVGHAVPARCPEHAVLTRVLLGPRPSLHRLRSGLLRLVRWLLCYYGEV
jgi:hypothetical protein